MIRVGTSGFSYKHWFGPFYPADLAKNKAFEYYKTQLDTVELNVSFYRLVSPSTYEKWHNLVNKDFLFAVKASRFVTHVKHLKDFESFKRFLKTIEPLQNNLGPILIQLPAIYKKDIGTLKHFIESLPVSNRYAFEFRNQSWFSDEVYQVLSDNNVALVLSQSPNYPYAEVITADFTYIRFHGPSELYGGSYSSQKLQQWARKIVAWNEEDIDVFAYFNNDAQAFAPKNALALKQLIENH